MIDRDYLESLYARYNRPECIHPDPLETILPFKNIHHREIAGLFASMLAYGRIAYILKSLHIIFNIIGDDPCEFILNMPDSEFPHRFERFRHRWTSGDDLSEFCSGIKSALLTYGSLNNCFLEGVSESSPDIHSASRNFLRILRKSSSRRPSLLPLHDGASANKRLNLYLRWMVRHDDVDPGGWRGVPASSLIVPVDAHIHRFALDNKLTRRLQNDRKTAIEITEFFRKINSDDPVKYDFALTRSAMQGINKS